MKIGLQINRFTWSGNDIGIGPTLANIARIADDSNFYSIWVMDHFFQIRNVGQEDEPMLEAYTTLGFLASLTKNVKLGTLVTGVIYREPALLAKAVTTLDVLSGGRAYLGIGAAWNESESQSLGFNFPTVKERFERLEESLKIINQMWEGNETPFEGKYYHLQRPLNRPQVLTKPHPPILIGGGGEQKTLYLVAKYADACNLFARLGEDELQRKLEILKQHCESVGRDYTEIEKTALNHISEGFDPNEVVEECRRFRQMGFDQVIYGIRNIEKITPLEIFAEKIIPEAASF